MNATLRQSRLIFILLIALSWYLFFFRLGSMALTDPDETFYAQSAREMADRDDWLTPHLYGKPQFEKPIFFYWLVVASYKIFGVNEAAARLPSALFGAIGIVATYLLGLLLFSRRAALFGALMMASSVEYVILARACVTDMVLAVFLLLAFLLYLYAYQRGRTWAYLAAALASALAVLTKGPVGVILPVAVVGLFLFAKRDLHSVLKMPLVPMAIVFIAVTVPWYIAMYRLHGKEFVDVFFGYHNFVRFLEPEHKSGAVVYYYIPVVFGGLLPWSVFLPVAAWRSVGILRKVKGAAGEAHLFLLLWFTVFFIFFSISQTRLPTYIFPALIPLGLIIGDLWDDAARRGAPAYMKRWMLRSHAVLSIALFAGAIGLFVYLKGRYPGMVLGACLSGVVLISGALASLVFLLKERAKASFIALIAAFVLLLLPLDVLVLPEIERYETGKMAALELKKRMKPGERVGAEASYCEGVAFYAGVFPANISKHHDMTKFLGSPDRVWGVLKEKNHIELYTSSRPFFRKPTYLVWRFGKKCIVTNQVPDDGIYIVKRELP